MKCTFCKIQSVRKAETSFNIRLNNHRKDANMLMVTIQKLSLHPYISNNLVTTSTNLIEQINNAINTDIDTMKIRLKRREDFWILKLDNLTPKGLNQELNYV